MKVLGMWLDLNRRVFKLFTELKLGLWCRLHPSRIGVLVRRGDDIRRAQRKG